MLHLTPLLKSMKQNLSKKLKEVTNCTIYVS